MARRSPHPAPPRADGPWCACLPLQYRREHDIYITAPTDLLKVGDVVPCTLATTNFGVRVYDAGDVARLDVEHGVTRSGWLATGDLATA